MAENLVFLLNKLSYQIVTEELEKRKDVLWRKKKEAYLNKWVARVREKGFNVLLNKTNEPLPVDPCVTDYGGNWSPTTLILEYGRELKDIGATRRNEMLVNSVKCLEEKEFDNLSEILKVLLILKKPFVESTVLAQNDLSLSGSDLLSNSLDSFSLLSGEFPSNLSKSSFKRVLQYEESWTKTFDLKFEALGEYSKKNILTPDKVSLESLFISKALNKHQSQSNCFVFTDFLNEHSSKSEKSVFHSSNIYPNEFPLFSDFTTTSPKLPNVRISQNFLPSSGHLRTTSEQMKRKLHLLEEEDHISSSAEARNLHSDEILNKRRPSNQSSIIELKRNSNFSHSFSVMSQKSPSQTKESTVVNNESLLLLKNFKKGSEGLDKACSNSKEIVLGLWEQEQNLIKEFRPELAENFPELRMISLMEFVEDVKHLLTGINSGTFFYDPEIKRFNMHYGTCLEDVTPESLYYFSDEFMEIGNCYVWLSSSASEIGKSNLETCTTISQAFWKSIFDFLELHYSVVLEIPPSTSLMVLKSCTKNLHEMIYTIAEICKVSKSNENLPQGGQLISYLMQMVEKVPRQCINNIIFGIIQNCCNVYLMCMLQTWMFRGQLESQNDEFFVDYRRQKVKTQTRTYYNSFYIADEKIPSFLRDYEESIFNCGKSVHFLKLFNPKDKFWQSLEKYEYPNMRLCLSDEELEKLERDFKEYEEKMMEICGEEISVKTLREEEKEKERNYQEYIKECKKAQEQEQELKRLKKNESLKAKKELQNKLLNDQINAIIAEKKRKEMEEKEEEKKFEEEMMKSKLQKQIVLQEEKEKVKNYYVNLLSQLEMQLHMAKMKEQSLQKLLSSTEDDWMDVVNDNKADSEEVPKAKDAETKEIGESVNAVDNEGNTQEGLDINSNQSFSVQLIRVNDRGSESEDVVLENLENCNAEGILYDENSNPSEPSLLERPDFSQNAAGKSLSHRTLAAEEAEKNKLKILRSEFGLAGRKGTAPAERKQPVEEKSMTDLERNKRRVLESEFGIFSRGSGSISLKSVPSKLEIVQENALNLNVGLYKTKGDSISDVCFETVKLKRKEKCTDLQNSKKSESLEKTPHKSESLGNSLTLSPEISKVSVSNKCEQVESSPNSSESSPKIQNEHYQKALLVDLQMFRRKNAYQDIFYNLKGIECESFPCTDFMKFQRYIRKSVLIPLKIQEKLANDALLKHLLKGENLLSHLNSLRGYFFLNDGEFGRSFTHNTFRSLAKCTEPQQFFERSNLSNIVNEALNYTIHNCEPNSQNLSFRIVQMPPYLNHSSHDVLTPFELSYKVDWPLNVILTEKALSKYKMIFRFLLKLKRINWTLNENFLYLNSQFKNKNIDRSMLACSSHYHKIQMYRHAMTQVMITLDDYIFSDGVQFPWIFFLKDLETTETIDHLYQKHVRYIKDVLTRCFLSKNSEDLLDCIHSLIELSLKFHYTAKSSVMEVVGGKYVHPKFQVLKITFNEFCSVIKSFLKTLKEKISSNQILKSHYVLIEKFDLKLA